MVRTCTSVDPILVDDPMAIVEAPELRSSYAYARNNPLTNVDVDGRKWESVHIDPAKAVALQKALQIDGKPLSAAQDAKLTQFFKDHKGLRGRMAMYWLGKQAKNEERQKFSDRLDSKPLLEFEFEDGKLKAVKVGFAVGKRKKFAIAQKPSPSTPTTPTAQGGAGGTGAASSTPASAGTPSPSPSPAAGAASTGPPVASAGSATSGSTASSPAKKTQTSAGGP